MFDSAQTLPLGTSLAYVNQWTGFESRKIAQAFTRLTLEQLKKVKPGDILWSEEELNPRHGKVYGFSSLQVTSVDQLSNGGVRFGYKSPTRVGSCGVINQNHDFYQVKDEEALAALVKKYPLALKIDH
jgi:hypothetical protein